VNLRDLEYVTALAEVKHFGRAAAHCNVSQPTLSAQIRKLEDQFELKLFERSGRQVLVTPEGEQIVERARSVLREYEELKGIALRVKNPYAGQYRLGVFPTLAPYYLPRIIPSIHQRFDQLRLILIEEKTDLLIDKLRAGKIDLALLALPLPVTGDDFQHAILFDEEILLAVSPKHRLSQRKTVRPRDVSGESLLLLEEGHCLRGHVLDFCRDHAIDENREFRATSLETLIQMVSTNMGSTLVPAMAVGTANPSLRYIPFMTPKPSRRIALVWRRNANQCDFYDELANFMRLQYSDPSA